MLFFPVFLYAYNRQNWLKLIPSIFLKTDSLWSSFQLSFHSMCLSYSIIIDMKGGEIMQRFDGETIERFAGQIMQRFAEEIIQDLLSK